MNEKKNPSRPRNSSQALALPGTVRSWIQQHRRAALGSLAKIFAAPMQVFMTCFVIGITLALPCGLFLVLDNVQAAGKHLDVSSRIVVFLRQGIADGNVSALGERLRHFDGIGTLEYVSPEKGLEDFRHWSGAGNVLQLLDTNPLPPVFIIRPTSQQAGDLALLVQRLQRLPEVDLVQADLDWVKKLQAMVTLARRFVFVLGALLALAVLLAVGNSIRLTLESRKDEIDVAKLVGGTDAYVSRPFLYTGAWYGLGGGLAGWLLVSIAGMYLAGPARELLILYGTGFAFDGYSASAGAILPLMGAILGLAGAWIACYRYLQQPGSSLTH